MPWPCCWFGLSPGACHRGPLPKTAAQSIQWSRRLSNGLALGSITVGALIVTVPLFLMLGPVVVRGLPALNSAFLTQLPKPVGETGGGIANAIVGSLEILALASVIGIPLGMGCGIFLAEYGRNKWGNIVRFTADVLNGVPSVVMGMTDLAV